MRDCRGDEGILRIGLKFYQFKIIEEHAATDFKGSGIHFQPEASVGGDGYLATGRFPYRGFWGFVAGEGEGEFAIQVDLGRQRILLIPIGVPGVFQGKEA